MVFVFSIFFIIGALVLNADDLTQGPSHILSINPDLNVWLTSYVGRKLLLEEFDIVPWGPRKPMNVGSLPQNIKKNRYLDSLPYDKTRVVLELLPNDSDSDYINANYIDGYNQMFEYVATQAPLPKTFNDFWRMIWQLNARKIVMVTRLIEKGKVMADKYWPDVLKVYGQIKITKVGEERIGNDIVIRTFILQKITNSDIRLITQFHYLNWPDNSKPPDTTSIIPFLQRVRECNPKNDAPLVVHDSGGIGRCGSYILLDSEIEKAENEGLIDLPKRMNHMRDQRQNLVHVKEEYLFIYEAVNDFFKTQSEKN